MIVLRALLICGAVLAAGCPKKSLTGARVNLLPGAKTPAGIRKIDFTFTLAGKTANTTLSDPAGADISFPTDAFLQIKSGSGALDVVASAKDANGTEVDLGTGSGTVVSGQTVAIDVRMQGGVATLAFSKTTQDFGTVAATRSSAPLGFTLQNTGPVVTGAVRLDIATASGFALLADDCSGKTLAAGASCTGSMQFKPLTDGAMSGTLTASATPGGAATVSLTGKAIPVFALTVSKPGTGSGTVTASPPGIDCGTTCSAIYDSGTVVTLTAAPANGSIFAGWSGGSCSGIGTCAVTMDAAKAVTALFSLNLVFTSALKLDGSDAANSNNTWNIWRTNANGPGLTPLTTATANAAHSVAPRWSPNGLQIVFSSALKPNTSNEANVSNTANVWLINATGTGLKALTKAAASGDVVLSMFPEWSPDGTRIVFRSARKLDGSDAANPPNNTPNIWLINADGNGLKALTKVTANGAGSWDPRWSPDGKRVVFSSSRNLNGNIDGVNSPNNTSNIWLIDADGNGLKALTKTTAKDANSASPQWSPDGKRIVFSSARNLDSTIDGVNSPNNTSNIWLIDADGNGLKPLTKVTAKDASSATPQWSPDGVQVTFASARNLDGQNAANVNSTSNVWRINADGSNLTPLTRATTSGDGSFMFPRWSLDATQIIFTSSRNLNGNDAAPKNNAFNIWRIKADGTGLMPVTKATATNADSFIIDSGCSSGNAELSFLSMVVAMAWIRRRRRTR